MDNIQNKIEQLPDNSNLYLAGWKNTSKGITPDPQPSGITTDEIKSIVSDLETAKRALERIANRPDAEMAAAKTLHYDMRGIAQAALKTGDLVKSSE